MSTPTQKEHFDRAMRSTEKITPVDEAKSLRLNKLGNDETLRKMMALTVHPDLHKVLERYVKWFGEAQVTVLEAPLPSTATPEKKLGLFSALFRQKMVPPVSEPTAKHLEKKKFTILVPNPKAGDKQIELVAENAVAGVDSDKPNIIVRFISEPVPNQRIPTDTRIKIELQIGKEDIITCSSIEEVINYLQGRINHTL